MKIKIVCQVGFVSTTVGACLLLGELQHNEDLFDQPAHFFGELPVTKDIFSGIQAGLPFTPQN